MEDEDKNIHETVRKFYGELALTSNSCCSDSCCDNSGLYLPDLLEGLPGEASFSLGCGDPISMAEMKPGETVLDLGSGGGLDCFLAAKQVGPEGRVIGVDMTPEMLERARGQAQKLGMENVEFRQGFLEALPVEDASIDVVISNCVINLSPEKTKVFAEIFRVLKPGGRVSVSDIVLDKELPGEVRESAAAWSACISGAVPAEEYARGLTEAGLVEVTVQPRQVFEAALPLVPVGAPYSAAITARKP
jgi:arsenite methyltransferase